MTWSYTQKIYQIPQKSFRTNKPIQQNLVHRINMQKSVGFLYTNNEKSEKEINKRIPFTVA